MQPTQSRKACGTHMGMLLHAANDEVLCGTCAQHERARTASVEGDPIPQGTYRQQHPDVFTDSPANQQRRRALLASTEYTQHG